MPNVILYEGKAYCKRENLGIVDSIVFDLLEDHKNEKQKNYIVFMDLYYSSPLIFQALYENGIDCV